MAVEACLRAFEDAGVPWPDIEVGYCASMNQTRMSGHQIARELGAAGATMTNVENASASGSAAFREAYLAIASGLHDVAIAIGVDKLLEYRRVPSRTSQQGSETLKAPVQTGAMQMFAERAREHMDRYGTTIDQLAKVSVKSHRNGSHNPYAHFQKAVTLQQVHQARVVVPPITVLHCCPWDEGAAAVVLAAKDVAARYTDRPCPKVLASACAGQTDSGVGAILADLTRETAGKAYNMAGCGPEDLDLIEVHDAMTIEEILYYEALGLCPLGEGGRLIDDGTTEIGGRSPVNTSGGLISMGHPIGPTGLGQIAELLWQMRGQAGGRQVPGNPDLGLAHMVGAGGVCFIHILAL
jgi:acetyl-CoA acetyltransferase